jgi:hypothetical protein
MVLCDHANFGSKQLYHHAEQMPFAQAEKYIRNCHAATRNLADQALRKIVHEQGLLGGCCVLTASGRPLPDLKSILASHSLIHAAEGVFYREAIANACERQSIPVQRLRERDVFDEANVLPLSEPDRRKVLENFGKQMGSPWTQDEKLSAMGAWLILAARRSVG